MYVIRCVVDMYDLGDVTFVRRILLGVFNQQSSTYILYIYAYPQNAHHVSLWHSFYLHVCDSVQEELAEGLHLIDFEQLKIENQTYNEKIEERNEVS